jgi:hypothetical protein
VIQELTRTVNAAQLSRIVDLPENMRYGNVNILIRFEQNTAPLRGVNTEALEKIWAIASRHIQSNSQERRKKRAGLKPAEINRKLADLSGEALPGAEYLYHEARVLEEAINGKYG